MTSWKLSFIVLLSWLTLLVPSAVFAQDNKSYSVALKDGRTIEVLFYGPNIVRLFCDPAGGTIHDPVAKPEAKILVDQPMKPTEVKCEQNTFTTSAIRLNIDGTDGRITITDLRTGKKVIEQTAPAIIKKFHAEITLKKHPGEHFFGGGMQNGRFSHTGKNIQIVNSNNWVDGGVASPAPFFWSTGGYGVLCHTFQPGRYDFGETNPQQVTILHEDDYADIFFMIDSQPTDLLNDYYQLTGNPVLLPKFGFYEGHLNAYNRDFWKESDSTGIRFEDGRYYKESQKDNGGIKESLNGEKDNYQFSARAVIDHYAKADMPLGWILPNDGYGAGYGQASTLDGNIENLRLFGDYARQHGVQVGLWTQSDLHPKEGIEPLLQRDIIKEIGTAGVRVLKTDVAWVGAGYSFGLNGVSDVAGIMPHVGHGARPFIITIDGWAGTQRYAGVWSGDQTGGRWEYIRFHIPTYIGSGLSGQPNIASDMDGIFGGKEPIILTRDFQWKTFTPMQLNMDGWGANPKYPMIMGEPWTSINRNYLKLKSELLPYTYSVAHEATHGLPIIRAMFLSDPNPYTLGRATQYQYMYGPSILVAPIYKATKSDKEGNDIRDGIYLPEGTWYDFFGTDIYPGGRIINSVSAPIWKLPVFVKGGAIIPTAIATNHPEATGDTLRRVEVFPQGSSAFDLIDDDGVTIDYLQGKTVTTHISMIQKGDKASVTFAKAQGSYNGFLPIKNTEVIVNVSTAPKKVELRQNGKRVKLHRAKGIDEYLHCTNVWFYDPAPELNRFSTPGSKASEIKIKGRPRVCIKTDKTDVTRTEQTFTITGFHLDTVNTQLHRHGVLSIPQPGDSIESTTSPSTQLRPTWKPVDNADYYEIAFDGQTYSNIKDCTLLFDDLLPETTYHFDVCAVNADGKSATSRITLTTEAKPQTDTQPKELPGDINHDGKIDMDDFTSYMNYMGLRKGDSDFGGYISGGDINRNGRIDAYDVSIVGTKVRGGVDLYGMKKLAGTITATCDKSSYKTGEPVVITITGHGMAAVNALGMALPYDPTQLQYQGSDPVGMLNMEDLTNDRLHTNGDKVLYPTFVNTGDKDVIEGDGILFRLTFKALKPFSAKQLKLRDGMIVDKALHTLEIQIK